MALDERLRRVNGALVSIRKLMVSAIFANPREHDHFRTQHAASRGFMCARSSVSGDSTYPTKKILGVVARTQRDREAYPGK
jgi:hypothetical protein